MADSTSLEADVGRYIFRGEGPLQATKTISKKPTSKKSSSFAPFDASKSPYAQRSMKNGAVQAGDAGGASVEGKQMLGTHIYLGGAPRSIRPADWLAAQVKNDPANTPHENHTKEVSLNAFVFFRWREQFCGRFFGLFFCLMCVDSPCPRSRIICGI